MLSFNIYHFILDLETLTVCTEASTPSTVKSYELKISILQSIFLSKIKSRASIGDGAEIQIYQTDCNYEMSQFLFFSGT